MTVTTIGYGDYTPSGALMQLYTILYAVFGIGFFITFNARLVQLALATQSSGGDSPGQGADADEGCTGPGRDRAQSHLLGGWRLPGRTVRGLGPTHLDRGVDEVRVPLERGLDLTAVA
jgi:hypothetical protein